MNWNRPSGVEAGAYVVGLGATTPLGRDAWSSAAAVRAGISALAEHPYMVDRTGQPMRVAFASWLPLECDPACRFASLLLPAIAQAMMPVALLAGHIRMALVLALPAPRPGLPLDLETALRDAILEQFTDRFVATATLTIGHAGALAGLRAAKRKIEEGEFDACLLCGVDSYLEPLTLEWLDELELLHGAGARQNAWGFVPGEAAGAVLVASSEVAECLEAEPLARVLRVSVACEEKRIRTKTVCTGEGLTAVFRDGLAGLPPGARVTDIYCDLNGDTYRAEEFGFSVLRTADAFVSPSDFVAPANCWGDVSAAFGPLAIMLASIAGRKKYTNGPFSLLWASSDGGERSAALLALPYDGHILRPTRIPNLAKTSHAVRHT